MREKDVMMMTMMMMMRLMDGGREDFFSAVACHIHSLNTMTSSSSSYPP